MENSKLKRLLFLPLLLLSFISFAQVQDGGAIQARDNPGVRAQIKRNLFALEVYDSILNQRLLTLIAGINVSGSVAITNANLDVALSTLAKESGGNIASINAKTPALGQALAANSTPVVLTAIQQAALTPPAPITNFANETGGNLAGINTKLPAQGQALAAASVPVVLTAIQQAALTPPAAITNFANETGGNLAAIKTDVDKIPAQGQALAAASTPVVLTAIQQAALTPPAAITNYANETGGNLAGINTKTPALGANTTANSEPVNIATDQLYSKVTGQSAQTAVVNNILTTSAGSAATDVTGYRSFSIQVVSTASGGTFIFEGSNDNVNFSVIVLYNQSAASGATVPISTTISATTSAFIYIGPIQFTFLRLRIATTITGGSIQAFSYFSQNGFTPGTLSVATNNQIFTVTPGTSAAQADGKANPTGGFVLNYPSLYNGATWDRPHGNWNTTTGDVGAKAATFNGATQTNFDARGAVITILCGTVSGTTPTLAAQLQFSYDAGTTWLNLGPATTNITTTANTASIFIYPTNFSVAGATPAALTNGATQSVQINATLPRTWRLVYTITGTTPSFAITAVYVNYQL